MDWKPSPEAKTAATKLSETLGADVIFYNGEIDPDSGHTFIKRAAGRRLRQNVFIILVTPGGDPDAAYRIGRCLQQKYEKVAMYISGWCKSAGTMIALAAHELYMGDHGELGPIDIQLSKSDEIWEMSSGLAVDAAISTLESTAFKMWETYLFDIKRRSNNLITFRTASEIASNLVVGLLKPVYEQIDPMKIGETGRAMNVTKRYGARLGGKSKNLKSSKSLEFLVSSYPSHRFVIDKDEARVLFTTVKDPTDEMRDLARHLGDNAIFPVKMNDDNSPFISFLSEEPSVAKAVEQETKNVRKPRATHGPLRRIARPSPRDPGGPASGAKARDQARPNSSGNGAARPSAGAK